MSSNFYYMSPHFEELIEKLEEIFQIDKQELDFGIYRILAARRKQIEDFLHNRLAEKVQSAFAGASSPQTEDDVYSHLLTFFSRYYDKGDFMSLRRYKGNTYAIPYNGEEVKLHWANADQYYIKSGESFSNYDFSLPSGVKVHFRLLKAEVTKDNAKDNDAARCYVLWDPSAAHGDEGGEDSELPSSPIEEKEGELYIYFQYLRFPKGTKQKEKSDEATSRFLSLLGSDTSLYREFYELGNPAPTGNDKSRTVFRKYLDDFTAKNTSDYFIHKDLKSFLNRELDFYIKNEMLRLDDIQSADAFSQIEIGLRKIQVFRSIASDLIDFMAQLENFQKKSWLKKKFVVQCDYCVSMNLVPQELRDEALSNPRQLEEWEKLNISESSLFPDARMVDTKFFDEKFKSKLLRKLDDIDNVCDGLLVKGENFQALSLIERKFADSIKVQYIDPPFNLNSGASYPYMTDYKDSTWLTLLANRHSLSMKMMKTEGAYFVRCDFHGNHYVRFLLDSEGLDYKTEILVKRSRNEAGSTKMDVTHEYLYLYGSSEHDIGKYKIERSISDIKWTGFLMPGERNPRQRQFLGITLYPPKGQHFSLKQEKVERLLEENHLRLRCKQCGCLYFQEKNTSELERRMKRKSEKYKYYDIKPKTKFHGVQTLCKCIECQSDQFGVEYLGAPEEYVNDNWLDISSYSRNYDFSTENSEECLERVIRFSDKGDTILDYFLGSGTTAATAKKMGRRWIGIEMADYIEKVTLPRLKLVYSGRDQKGIAYSGGNQGGVFKYIKLESYEDTLNNLELEENGGKLSGELRLQDEYLLRYMLDIESRGSLIDTDTFQHPFDYSLKIAVDSSGASEPHKIDLVETFNYLIGIHVVSQDRRIEKGYVMVEGRERGGAKVLIVWRDCDKINNDALNELLEKKRIRPGDSEFDLIYVNGDHNIASRRLGRDEMKELKVRSLEEEFLTRMFEET